MKATAITIEFGITRPNHVLASGCAAGLDAIGIAMMLVRSGMASRALAVAVDLPLVPLLLDNYASWNSIPLTCMRTLIIRIHPGFIPAEVLRRWRSKRSTVIFPN